MQVVLRESSVKAFPENEDVTLKYKWAGNELPRFLNNHIYLTASTLIFTAMNIIFRESVKITNMYKSYPSWVSIIVNNTSNRSYIV